MRFWGVRGSHPTPITPAYLKQKISAVVQRIQSADIIDQDARERFLASLPNYIFSTPGGNTPCIEIRPHPGQLFIFDAGTGIVELSKLLRKEGVPGQEIHLFFGHFHYDHIQGFPFFGPAYNPQTTLHLYSPEPDFENTLKNHMRHPYFPVTMEETMTKKMFFHQIQCDTELNFPGGTTVISHPLRHPGRAYGYRIENAKKSIVIASDFELLESDFSPDKEALRFFMGPDYLVLDTMYTLGEAIEKMNWGHSSFSIGVEFAIRMKVKNLLLFHHEPQNDDRKVYTNLRNAVLFSARMGADSLRIVLSEEGMEISV